MSKFTKGPWHFIGNSWQFTTVNNADKIAICQLDLEDWCVTEENQDELEIEQARVAALLSSAPDLYEALEDAESLISGDLVGAEWKLACNAFLAKARAALAKAKGASHE